MLTAITSPVAGIVYGNRSFSEPQRFPSLSTPVASGIYAILVPDSSYRPRPFRVIYFGESNNLFTRVCTSHEKYADWQREAGVNSLYGTSDLYVAFHPTNDLTDQRLRDAECELINQYLPPCNDRVDKLGLLRSLLR